MIPRRLGELARQRFEIYPVATITGPRQAGKTTLCKMAFPDLPYASLEEPDTREEALRDPRGFLARYPDGAILDEVQRAPDLLSYVQVIVDERGRNGLFVLTGSHNFSLLRTISQSLAGRTAVLDLLPPSLDELRLFAAPPRSLADTLLFGAYPRIHDQAIPPMEFHADYVRTYVERDVREVLNVGDLTTFQTFLRLCAGRSGQLLNLTSLADDAGISHKTAKAWISVLEASYLVLRLAPWFCNFSKRLIKTPKLYFLDSGLLCYLLGIRTPEQLATHPLRGPVFESWVVSEVVKSRWNAGIRDPIHFYRDRRGNEVDIVLGLPDRTVAVEVKSGQTLSSAAFGPLHRLAELLPSQPLLPHACELRLVYAGDQAHVQSGVRTVPWSDVPDQVWHAS